MTVDVADGSSDWMTLGSSVEAVEGPTMGAVLGTSPGDDDGITEGRADGSSDGLTLGTSVEAVEGPAVVDDNCGYADLSLVAIPVGISSVEVISVGSSFVVISEDFICVCFVVFFRLGDDAC